ncbi:MAG: hypothetical protein U9N61_05365 [Euryarchaeota archaeon]|nr:hypothetical protein [Euryarchaeota archaeon]
MLEIYSIHDLASLGLDPSDFRTKIRGREWAGPCPRCGGTDRFIVSNGAFRCRAEGHGCGWAGSYAQLAMAHGIELSPEEQKAIQEKARKRAEAQKERDRKDRERHLHTLNTVDVHGKTFWQIYHANLLRNQAEMNRLHHQGITERVVRKFQIGYDPRAWWRNLDNHFEYRPGITIPILYDRYCYNLRYRILKVEDNKYHPWKGGLGVQFFDATIAGPNVWIIEGEKKAMVFWNHGLSAIGVFGAETYQDEWSDWLNKRFDHVYIALDGEATDPKIIKQITRAAERIRASIGPSATIVSIPGKPDDMLLSDQYSAEYFRGLTE